MWEFYINPLNEPTIVRKVISEDPIDKVSYYLESVVARGTGDNAYISGIEWVEKLELLRKL